MLAEDLTVEFEAELFPWAARRELWTFLALPDDVTADVREFAGDLPRGFGAVAVRARIGARTWRTSVFPQGAAGPYVLPVKRAVRDACGLAVGDRVRAVVELLP